MDDLTRSWAPARGLIALTWGGAVVALLLALVTGDAGARLLALVAAVGLAGYATFSAVARPRLVVDTSGLTVRGFRGPRHHRWAQVQRVRVMRHRRFGREIAQLEIDATDDDGHERLIVLGKLDLDAMPQDVLEAIAAVRGL